MILQSAFQAAFESFERTGDPSAGSEAASLALQLGDHAECRSIAQRVLTMLDRGNMDRLNYRQLASGAEAYLLLGEMDQARQWYRKVAVSSSDHHDAIAAMRKQARINLEALGLDRHALDELLPIPRIAAFAGHMVDAPGRAIPRFPSGKIEAVRHALAERLRSLKIGYGFCSAARGSDILFIEELKKTGSRPKVFLPFPREHFKKTSVGDGWNERFDAALNGLVVVELSQSVPGQDRRPEAYAACNRAIRQDAIAKATSLDEQPILLAVYNGNPGDGTGGTADAVREWRHTHHQIEIIDISQL
jgi:tetratricopeptide (TPR) repeat protein